MGGGRDGGEVDKHGGGRRADCGHIIHEICMGQTLIGMVVILSTSGTGVWTGLTLPFVFLLFLLSMRWNEDRV